MSAKVDNASRRVKVLVITCSLANHSLRFLRIICREVAFGWCEDAVFAYVHLCLSHFYSENIQSRSTAMHVYIHSTCCRMSLILFREFLAISFDHINYRAVRSACGFICQTAMDIRIDSIYFPYVFASEHS